MKNSLGRMGVGLASAAIATMSLSGCATTARLDARFDTDTVGSPPSTYPSPSPPNDVLTYTGTYVTATVEPDPAGGRWLRIVPTPAFLTAPDFRRRAIVATSDTFTTNSPRNIRGHLRLRVTGVGTVIVGLRPLQGSQFGDFIAGFLVGSYPASGAVYLLPGFTLERVEDNTFSFSPAGKLDDYQPGTVIDINWSVDQASRRLAATSGGRSSHSITFPGASGGVGTVPIQKLSVWVWLERPNADTQLFVDRLFAEEVR
jgi:hypothetical protein